MDYNRDRRDRRDHRDHRDWDHGVIRYRTGVFIIIVRHCHTGVPKWSSRFEFHSKSMTNDPPYARSSGGLSRSCSEVRTDRSEVRGSGVGRAALEACGNCQATYIRSCPALATASWRGNFLQGLSLVPNRKRRAARLINTRQFKVENETDLPSPVIAEIVERFCRETPTIPRGEAGLAMLRTSRGNYKVDAFPDTKTIRVAGPYTEEAIDAFHKLAEHTGTELTTTSWEDGEDVYHHRGGYSWTRCCARHGSATILWYRTSAMSGRASPNSSRLPATQSTAKSRW